VSIQASVGPESTTALVIDRFVDIPRSVETLIGIEGVYAKGELISAANSVQLKDRARRCSSSAALSAGTSNSSMGARIVILARSTVTSAFAVKIQTGTLPDRLISGVF
jgi:hypothetical protein